jgi:hypothetical protein
VCKDDERTELSVEEGEAGCNGDKRMELGIAQWKPGDWHSKRCSPAKRQKNRKAEHGNDSPERLPRSLQRGRRLTVLLVSCGIGSHAVRLRGIRIRGLRPEM